MDRRTFGIASVAATVYGLARLSSAGSAEVLDLSQLVEAARQEHGVPGMAAAAVRDGRLVAEGTAGVRKMGGNERIALDDRFGMGSCTKRMTAAMIARLIDKGRLSFEMTLAEALPGLTMREDYRGVTVAQLLTHTGGLPTYTRVAQDVTPNLFKLQGNRREQRTQFIELLLQEEPIAKPGTTGNYSNAGYALVGFVAEQRTGRSWEELMRDEVFEPLEMKNAGFGRPRSKDRPNEPWLHHRTGRGFEPEAEDRVNAMEAFAPAGDVHCSIRDFAKFAAYELAAARGENRLLSAETAQRFIDVMNSGPRLSAGVKGPVVKNGPDVKGGGAKTKGPKGAKKGKSPPGANAFFGGSAFVASGCMLWPEENITTVVSVNAGDAGETVRLTLVKVKERVSAGG